MVSGMHRSSSFRKIFVKVPGGRTVVHRRLRKPSRATCSINNTPLHGIKTTRHTRLQNTPKTQKRPQRAFGGVLSSSAARREIIGRARKL